MLAFLVNLPISDPMLLSLSATMCAFLAESVKHRVA